MDFALRKPFLRRLAIGLGLGVVLTACGTAALQHEESRLTFRVVRDTPGWYTGMPDGVQEFDLPVASADASSISMPGGGRPRAAGPTRPRSCICTAPAGA